MTKSDGVKSTSYEDLYELLATAPTTDKLLVFDNLNAHIIIVHAAWKEPPGRHGNSGCNSIGLLLLQTCARKQSSSDQHFLPFVDMWEGGMDSASLVQLSPA
ncbi:hypothetical protein SprV_0702426000 [Sparganum proliferum]